MNTIDKLKAKVKESWDKRPDHRPAVKASKDWITENPSEFAMGIALTLQTLFLAEIESDLEETRDAARLSAAVDLSEYRGRH